MKSTRIIDPAAGEAIAVLTDDLVIEAERDETSALEAATVDALLDEIGPARSCRVRTTAHEPVVTPWMRLSEEEKDAVRAERRRARLRVVAGDAAVSREQEGWAA